MENYTKKEITEFGTICYYNADGQEHRLDGPAVEYSNGDKIWYINGKVHREDEPAIIFASGTKKWFSYGRKHRLIGPAIVYAISDVEWYINNTYYTKSCHNRLVLFSMLEKQRVCLEVEKQD